MSNKEQRSMHFLKKYLKKTCLSQGIMILMYASLNTGYHYVSIFEEKDSRKR